MKLIVREHINAIAEPVKKVFTVTIDAVNAYGRIPSNIGLMKGDLIAFRGEGDPVRLPVGSDGKVLTADSSSPTGLVWSDAAGGGGGATVEIYNQTGATIPAGSVVGAVPYIGADDFVGLEMFRAAKYTAGTLYVLSDDCPNNSTVQCYCVPDTVCPVLCDTDAVAQDDLIGVSANGACHSLESYVTLPLGRATVGIALEAKASGSVGTVKVRLVSNPTVQAHSESAVSTTYGTCFMVDESADSTFRVAPVKKGKQPFGVQANKESVANAVVLLHTHQNEQVAVLADSTEIKVGDWLVPSATADGQVRNGSGYGIGEALTAKASGTAGLVRVHLNLKYGISPRAWWLPSGITEDQVIAAYQFVGRASEADALINVNNGTEYALIKSSSDITWNSEKGFTMPSAWSSGLDNTTLRGVIASSGISAGFGFAGVDISDNTKTAGGLKISSNKYLLVRGWRGDLSGTSTILGYLSVGNATNNTVYRSATKYEKGVVTADWLSTPVLYKDGVLESLVTNNTMGSGLTNALGIFGQAASSISTAYVLPFDVTAIVFYSTQLSAEQHLELVNNIRALGGIDE